MSGEATIISKENIGKRQSVGSGLVSVRSGGSLGTPLYPNSSGVVYEQTILEKGSANVGIYNGGAIVSVSKEKCVKNQKNQSCKKSTNKLGFLQKVEKSN